MRRIRIFLFLSYSHWKLKRSVSAPKCQFSPAGRSLIQPFLEPFEHSLGPKSSIKRLFQPTVGPISALGSNQPKLIWLYWPWFKGAKLDSKIGLYFTHRNGTIFRAKTDLSDLECIIFIYVFLSTGTQACLVWSELTSINLPTHSLGCLDGLHNFAAVKGSYWPSGFSSLGGIEIPMAWG